MNQTYNYFEQQELPSFVLCYPDKTEIRSLPLAHDIQNTLKYNALSELSFNYPESKDAGLEIDPAYSELQGKMLVLVVGVGYYIIQSSDEDLSGSVPIKNISCLSLEAELLSRRITGFNGTYQFVALVESVLSIIPTWSIGTVDTSIAELYRTFKPNNSTAYNFLVTEVEKAYGCVFEFNTFNRTVSAISNALPSLDNNIYLSLDNLASEIEFKEITEEICTALYCYGDGSLDIRTVNPLGTNAIYNFDYFKEWMSQELTDSLEIWEQAVADQQEDYSNRLTILSDKIASSVTLNSDFVELLSQLASMNTTRDAILNETPPGSTTSIDAQIANQLLSIASKEVDINSLQVAINDEKVELKKIVFSLYFTAQLSYEDFVDDVLWAKTSISSMTSAWRPIYEKPTYPTFNQQYFDDNVVNIETLFINLEDNNQDLYDYISGGFSTYPASGAEIIDILGYIDTELDTLDELYALLQSIAVTTSITNTLDDIRSRLVAYREIISYPSNMSYERYVELSSYIYDNTYINKNIITTDQMDGSEKQAWAQELYNQSQNILAKTSIPRYEISGSFANFIALKQFSYFTSQLTLGEPITIKKDDGDTIVAILLELDISYDKPDDFSITFGNSFRLDNPSFIYADLMEKGAHLGSSFSTTSITGGSVGGMSVSNTGLSIGGSDGYPSTGTISSDGYISFGINPPTTYGNFVGAWLGYLDSPKFSLYSDINNFLQWDGTRLLIKARNFTLDAFGNITASNVNLTGAITASSGYVGGWLIEATQISSDSGTAFINSATPAIGLGGATDYLTGTGFFVGQNSGLYKMHLGNPALEHLSWDGTALNLTGVFNNTDEALELEIMKMSFQTISWAQFAIFDSFEDDSKRESPEPFTYSAVVYNSRLNNGNDTTASKTFGFTSKTYSDITTVFSSTSTGVGLGYLEDTEAVWFTNQYVGYELVDSGLNVFDIIESNMTGGGLGTLVVSGTPLSGAYSIRSELPTTAVAFCSFSDSSNGGYGEVTLEASFNGGSNWQTFLSTATSVNSIGGAVVIDFPGRDFIFRTSMKNDGAGNGAVVFKVLVCTDPSIWG